MLAYGVPYGYVDEYVRIGETITIESLEKFVNAMVSIYSNEYLRSPNINDVARLLEVGESRGFPRMSLDMEELPICVERYVLWPLP